MPALLLKQHCVLQTQAASTSLERDVQELAALWEQAGVNQSSPSGGEVVTYWFD